MVNTTRLILPLMSAAQSQKHITHNDAIIKLDQIVQLSVISSALASPPVSPTEGDRYIIGSSATGAWAGKDLNVAYYVNGLWTFLIPRIGWQAYDETVNTMLVWTGSAWQNLLTAAGVITTTTINNNTLSGRLTTLGLGGATADSTNRLSIISPAALFNNAGTSIAVALNKNASGNDAGLTFQTGFSSRALFGLLGNDHFTVKTTPDGSTYKTGMIISKDTAAVSLVEHPKFSCYCDFAQDYTAGSWQDFLVNNARHNDQGDLTIASNIGTFTAPHDGYYMFGIMATFEASSTAPTKMQVGLRVNTTDPTGDRIGTAGDAALTDGETQAQVVGLLKLQTGDTVKPRILFATNDGRIKANENAFWGCQIA